MLAKAKSIQSKLLYLASVDFRCCLADFVVVRSGNFNLTNSAGTFRNAGAYGQGWSSRAAAYTSSTSATAYYLEYRPTDVNPSNGPNNRWNGFALRCLDFAAVGADLLTRT